MAINRKALALVAVLGFAVSVSCSSSTPTSRSSPGSPASSSSSSAGAAKAGELISKEVLDAPSLRGTLLRVTYRSRSVRGKDITVSGLIAYPNGPAPPSGRPVLSWAHGTTGLADVCAPSRDAAGFASMTAAVNTFLDKGMVLTATDYEGLGEPGLHPYIVGTSEGRGVLDIVRAARQIGDAAASDRVVIWGHSQGGHAALFANQIASTWAPELKILGTVAGAPATELPLLAAALANSPYSFYEVMVAGGFAAAYPELALSDVLTDEAIARISVLDTGCASDVAKAYADLPPAKAQKADPMSVPAWKARLEENDPGHVRTDSPIFIYQGSNDEQIPVAASLLLFNRLCGLGQVVERKIYEGQTHAGVVPVAFGDIVSWIDARVAGTQAVSGCPKG